MIRHSTLKAGDKLIADGGFTCLKEGEIVTLEKDNDGELFFRCTGADYGKLATEARPEKHGLTGQTNDAGFVVGFRRADPPEASHRRKETPPPPPPDEMATFGGDGQGTGCAIAIVIWLAALGSSIVYGVFQYV